MAALVEAARKRLKKKKAKRDAEKRARDLEQLSPDQYRMRWGICPDGYNWDPAEKTCEERDPEPGESRDKMTKDERDEEDRERRERQDREARRQAKEIEKEFGLGPDEDEPDEDELELEEPEQEPEPPPRIDQPEPDDVEPDELEVDVDDLEVDEDEPGEEVDVDDLEVDEDEPEVDEDDEAPPPRPPQPEPPLPDDPKLAEQVKRRREQRKKLTDLFNKSPKKYEKEVARMREAGELPDQETAKMLAKIKNIDELPDEVLQDKDKVKEIIRQQDEQREHEERMLQHAQEALKAFDAQRKRAENAGKRPPDFEPVKFLRDLELMYDRPLPERSEELDKKLNARGDDFLRGAISGGQDRGSKSYWWKELFENLTRPLPKWPTSAAVQGEVMQKRSDEIARSELTRAKVLTSPDVTDMEPRELGFPPYDRDRPSRKHMPSEPSGRPAFPPYDGVESVEYRERDAKMQGFPPYDGKGEPHDTETIGLPPYNKKPAHEGRGFPPFDERRSVYEERHETVKEAVR